MLTNKVVVLSDTYNYPSVEFNNTVYDLVKMNDYIVDNLYRGKRVIVNDKEVKLIMTWENKEKNYV